MNAVTSVAGNMIGTTHWCGIMDGCPAIAVSYHSGADLWVYKGEVWQRHKKYEGLSKLFEDLQPETAEEQEPLSSDEMVQMAGKIICLGTRRYVVSYSGPRAVAIVDCHKPKQYTAYEIWDQFSWTDGSRICKGSLDNQPT